MILSLIDNRNGVTRNHDYRIITTTSMIWDGLGPERQGLGFVARCETVPADRYNHALNR